MNKLSVVCRLPPLIAEPCRYTFTNSISVTLNNLTDSLLAAVLEAVIDAGKEDLTVDGVSFSLSDRLSYAKTVEARKQASQDALTTAQQYAEVLLL